MATQTNEAQELKIINAGEAKQMNGRGGEMANKSEKNIVVDVERETHGATFSVC